MNPTEVLNMDKRAYFQSGFCLRKTELEIAHKLLLSVQSVDELATTDAAKKNETIVDTPATAAVRNEKTVPESKSASPIDDIDELLRDDDDEDVAEEHEGKTNEQETVAVKQKSKLSRPNMTKS